MSSYSVMRKENNRMQNSNINTRNVKIGRITWRTLALFSTVIYIVLSTIFEESRIGLARYASIGILICLGCCGAYVLIGKKIKIDRLILGLFIFGVILTLSTLYSPTSNSLMTTYIYRYWTSWILIVLVGNVIQNERDIQMIIHGYIIAGSLLALYVYLFYGIQSLSSLTSRLTNELANQNSIGISCACSFIFAVIELTTNKDRIRYMYLIPMVITLPACLYSGSRKSIILILISVFAFFLLYSENKQITKRLLLGGAIIGGIVYIIQNISAFSIIHSRFEQLFSMLGRGNAILDTGDINRMKYIENGLEAFKNSPIWGNGFAYSYYLFGTYSHNNYVELLMNNGIIGFAAYYIIHIGIITNTIKIRFFSKKISAVLAVIMIMILFIDVGSVNYYSRYILILLCIEGKLASYFKTIYNNDVVEAI